MSDQRQKSQIAVVIPTHNRARFLAESLQSVMAQTSRVDRIIVIDDTDGDESRLLVERYAASSSSLLQWYRRTDGRPGASASRNAGARLANSEYLAFLDDDDVWENSFIERTLTRMQQFDSALGVSWTDFIRDDFRGRGLRMPSDVNIDMVLHQNPGLTGSNFIIRREEFLRIGAFDEALPVANDRDFLIRVLDAGITPAVVDEPLVQQRAHAYGQLTARTEARARGLEAFGAKYADRMNRRDKRELRRVIHSVRRVSGATLLSRAWHAFAQFSLDRPSRLLPALAARLAGRPEVYK